MSAPEPRSALSRAARPGRSGAQGAHPLMVSERRVAMSLVQARRGSEAALSDAVAAAFGLGLPPSGYAATAGTTTAIWMQPGCWLVAAPRAGEGELARRLSQACGELATVVDQSHGKCVLRIVGERARDVLAKGCRIDLHPRVFATGRAATTVIAHVSCTIVQSDAAPAFDLFVPATFAEAFLEWLLASAAEYGCELREPTG